YILRKSSSRQSQEVLQKEHNELLDKARAKKGKLTPWQPHHLTQLSNQLDFSFSKGFTRKFNGFIFDQSRDQRLLAFRRIDRGLADFTSKIIALSSDFELYFEQEKTSVTIHYNGKVLGKLIKPHALLRMDNQQVGSISRSEGKEATYEVILHGETVASFAKGTEKRSFLTNPHFKSKYSSTGMENDMIIENPTANYGMVRLHRELSESEYPWVLALLVYEIVFYSIDFTQ
ncbi:MAG: hypothetical protein AAFQ98_26805, partial [Bacteroidota bacterium]